MTPPQLRLTIAWRSALPMKQAEVRGQVGLNGTIPPETQQLLDRAESYYVVTVMGVPARYARALQNIKAETFLKRDQKAPIVPEESIAQQAGANLILAFGFPRTDAITLQDKDVEFVTKVGQIEIKKKFSLKDMLFHGQLEL